MQLAISVRTFLSGLFLFAACAAAHAAAPYKVGDTLEAFEVKDAKEGSFAYEPGKLALLVVSYEMSTGKAVNTYLATKPADYLETHRAAFLANIHGMPGIGRFFALPKMKRYPHRILLGDSETLLARYPSKEGFVTVFSFDAKGVITEIRQIDPDKDAASLIEGAKRG